MKILIASDHGGFALKTHLIQTLGASYLPGESSSEFADLGPSDEKSVDYPDFAKKLCEKLLAGEGHFGILVCGSGQGMNMKANRYKGIRSALCWDLPSAKLSREHNNANVLCLGGRLIPFGYATEIAKTFLSTEFLGGRHEARVKKLDL